MDYTAVRHLENSGSVRVDVASLQVLQALEVQPDEPLRVLLQGNNESLKCHKGCQCRQEAP